MARRTQYYMAVVLLILGGVAIWAGLTKPWNTPRRVAHRLCSPYNLEPDDIDDLIETIANSNLSRPQLLRLYRDTFCGHGETDCVGCVLALVSAAGVK